MSIRRDIAPNGATTPRPDAPGEHCNGMTTWFKHRAKRPGAVRTGDMPASVSGHQNLLPDRRGLEHAGYEDRRTAAEKSVPRAVWIAQGRTAGIMFIIRTNFLTRKNGYPDIYILKHKNQHITKKIKIMHI
jgi:hypothetical protein